jgi:hypothetical protein
MRTGLNIDDDEVRMKPYRAVTANSLPFATLRRANALKGVLNESQAASIDVSQ